MLATIGARYHERVDHSLIRRSGDLPMPLRMLIPLGALLLVISLVPARANDAATPTASPMASPVALANDCDGLEAYFLALATLVRDDPGLARMRAARFDALALPAADAALVVEDLNRLLPQVMAMPVPPAVRTYHDAYLAMLTWYRDLAEHRDPVSHQRLINNDRQLFGNLGIGMQQGQLACGGERWNAAYEAAFPG